MNKKEINILQINKEIGFFTTKMHFIMNAIRGANADIAVVSEANLGHILPKRVKDFNDVMDDYHIEQKCLPGDSASRVIIIIKHGMEYERLLHNENNKMLP